MSEIDTIPPKKQRRIAMDKKIWSNLKTLILFILGTYGEKTFVLLHTFIIRMSPQSFSFICLSGIAAMLILLSKE